MDDLDRTVIGCLLSDGRASYAQIGAKVGLSAPAVKRRMDRLLDDGAITGFTAVVAPERLGWAVEAYVELHCKGQVSPEEIRDALVKVPEVMDACTVSGAADAIVHILASDVRHLEKALEHLRIEANVDHTDTAIVLSRLIDRRHTV